MTEQEQREWEERLRVAVAKTLAMRVHMRQERTRMGVRRAVGVNRRHDAKLARGTRSVSTPTLTTDEGLHSVDTPAEGVATSNTPALATTEGSRE